MPTCEVIAGTNHFTIVDELIRPGSAVLAQIVELARETASLRQLVLAPQCQAGIDHRVRDGRQPAPLGRSNLRQRRRQPLGGAVEAGHALDVVADVDQCFADRIEIDQRYAKLLLQ